MALSEAEVERTVALRREGGTIKAIAAEMHRAERTISDVLRRRGLPLLVGGRQTVAWPEALLGEAERLRRDEGLSYREIVARLGIANPDRLRDIGCARGWPRQFDAGRGAREQIKTIAALLAQGLSWRAAAARLGLTKGQVAGRVWRAAHPYGGVKRPARPCRSCPFCHRPFKRRRDEDEYHFRDRPSCGRDECVRAAEAQRAHEKALLAAALAAQRKRDEAETHATRKALIPQWPSAGNFSAHNLPHGNSRVTAFVLPPPTIVPSEGWF